MKHHKKHDRSSKTEMVDHEKKDGHMHGMHRPGHHYSDSNLKPDETHHKKHQDMGTEAKKARLPGQMYVPAHCHNESDFAGEER